MNFFSNLTEFSVNVLRVSARPLWLKLGHDKSCKKEPSNSKNTSDSTIESFKIGIPSTFFGFTLQP